MFSRSVSGSRFTLKRLYSNKLAPQEIAEKEVLKSKLKSGLTVVSVDVANKYSNVSVFARAGSRFEEPAVNSGVSHCLRSASCLTSDDASAWKATQLLSSFGGDYSVTGTREHIIYKLRSGRRVWRDLVTEVLAPNITGGKYLWWELDSISKAMKSQVAEARKDITFGLMDAVHEASFRGGLANSIICRDELVGSHSPDTVKEFFRARFSPENLVLVGTGVDHDELCDVGDSLGLEQGGTSIDANSGFVSSEVRRFMPGDQVHVGLSFAGVSLNDQDAIAVAVLQHVLGSNSFIKRQSGKASGLGSLVTNKISDPFSLSCFNINYSDCGVLGLCMQSKSKSAAALLTAVTDETSAMAAGNISDKAVEAAKQSLKSNVLMRTETADGIIEDAGTQVSILGDYAGREQVINKIEAISTSQVNRVAKKVLGGPKSLAVVGNTAASPYLADL